MMSITTKVPLYATQGGGYVIWDASQKLYIWREVPKDFPEFKIGDPMPEEWGTTPANQAAIEDMNGNDDFDDWNPENYSI